MGTITDVGANINYQGDDGNTTSYIKIDPSSVPFGYTPYYDSNLGSGAYTYGGQYYVPNTYTGVQGASTTNNTAPSDPYASQRGEDTAFLDTQMDYLRNLLTRADTTKEQGMTQIGDSYNKELTRGNEDQSRTLRDYSTKELTTQQDREKGLGDVDRNANTLANSLRRILGMASGRGSSAYKFAAPQAVAQKASTERGNVLETTGRNISNINTARGDAMSQFERYLQDLQDQRTEKESGLSSDVETQKQDYNSRLAQAAGEKARVSGAGYGGIRAAQQPYLDSVNAGNSALDRIFQSSRTAYTPKPVSYQTPDIGQYTVDKAAINANRQFGGSDPTSPYSYFARKKFNEA